MKTTPPTSQTRSFGWLVGGVCLAVAAILLAKEFSLAGGILLGVGAALTLGATVAPRLLRPMERVWTRCGAALGWFNTRLILGGIFLVGVVPLGAVLRALGKDPLRAQWNAERDSYLIDRRVRRFSAESFERQF